MSVNWVNFVGDTIIVICLCLLIWILSTYFTGKKRHGIGRFSIGPIVKGTAPHASSEQARDPKSIDPVVLAWLREEPVKREYTNDWVTGAPAPVGVGIAHMAGGDIASVKFKEEAEKSENVLHAGDMRLVNAGFKTSFQHWDGEKWSEGFGDKDSIDCVNTPVDTVALRAHIAELDLIVNQFSEKVKEIKKDLDTQSHYTL